MDKIALAHSLSCSTDVWDPHVRVFFNLSVPAGEIERERERLRGREPVRQ
jgi:hypothetical protein